MSEHDSDWLKSARQLKAQTLPLRLHVDVAVIGAGIAGMTAALRLKEAGRSVAVFEMNQLGQGETGHTTAQVTEILDISYRQLEKNLGLEGSRRIAQSVILANAEIKRMVDRLQIDCDHQDVPGFLFSERRKISKLSGKRSRPLSARV